MNFIKHIAAKVKDLDKSNLSLFLLKKRRNGEVKAKVRSPPTLVQNEQK